MFHFGHPGYDALKSPQTSVALSPFEQRANHRLCVLPPDKGHVWNTTLRAITVLGSLKSGKSSMSLASISRVYLDGRPRWRLRCNVGIYR